MAEETQNTDPNTEGLAALGAIGGDVPAAVEPKLSSAEQLPCFVSSP